MFNNILREVRISRKLTQERLSEMVGIGLRNYQYYEQGRTVPSFDVLIKLADVLNVSIDYLVGRIENEGHPQKSGLHLTVAELLDFYETNNNR